MFIPTTSAYSICLLKNRLTLRQSRWLKLLKVYCISVVYHRGKANVVADALSHMIMGRVSHVEEAKNDLVKDVHSLARLGVRLQDSPNGVFMVHHNSESSLVLKVKSKQHLINHW